MAKVKIRDDHVKMFKNGRPKLIPMLAVEAWIKDGLLEASGYTFAPRAQAIYEEWIVEETRRRKLARKRPEIIQRDPGFADISRAVGEAAEAPMPDAIEPSIEDLPDVADLPKDSEAGALTTESAGVVPVAEVTEILE